MSRSIPAVALIMCAIIVVAGMTPAAPVPQPKVPADEQEWLLARSKNFAEQGRIDLFVVATAALKLKTDDLRLWEPAADVGRKLIEKAEMKGDRKPQDTPSSFKDFATYLEDWKPTFTRTDETYFRPDPDKAIPPRAFYYEVIQAPGVVDPGGIASCLILSRGGVQAGTGIAASVVFANGDVTARTIMQSVIIVCDGDVTVAERQIGRSVIVARGNITAPAAGTVTLMAGGKVTLEHKPVNRGGGPPSLIMEKQSKMLGVTFFELATVGLEVKAAEKVVGVANVAARSAAQKAGLKAGDAILEVGGKKPDSAESLRRLLRDALAVGDATVKVRRGRDTLSVKMSLPE
jgi:hypothetical protein